MPQEWLPFVPRGEIQINAAVSCHVREGKYWYFVHDMPVFSHPEGDKRSFRMFTAQLCCTEAARQVEIIEAFGVSKASVLRSVKKYREGGIEAFYSKAKTRGRKKTITDEVIEKAEELFSEGYTRREAAQELGVTYSALAKAISDGRIVGPEAFKKN